MPFPQSGGVDLQTLTGVKEYLFARLATQQTTNIAAGDHLKLDTVVASRGGSVALDTSTAYVTTIGAAAIGRFTLKANKLYHLRCTVPYILGSGATTLLEAQFYDATGNAVIPGVNLALLNAATASFDQGDGAAEAFFTPGQDSLVEVRIVTATALTQIGITGLRGPSVLIETF